MITQHSEDVHDDYGRTINQSRVSCKSDGLPADSVNYLNGLCSRQPDFSSRSESQPAQPPRTRPIRGLYRTGNNENGLGEYTFRTTSATRFLSERWSSCPCEACVREHAPGCCMHYRLYQAAVKFVQSTYDEKSVRPALRRVISTEGPAITAHVDDHHSPLPDKPAVEANFVLPCAHRSRGRRQDEETRPNHYTLAPIKKVSESAILESNEPVGECTHGVANGWVGECTHINANGWVGELRPPIMPKPIRLRDGERRGWWSAKEFDRRTRMRAIVMGAVNDRRTKLLLDTGASVSVISKSLAKKLKLITSVSAGRRIGVQDITEGKVSSCEWDTVKLTLGSELTYELIIWVVPQCAGVDVLLGTDFMIPAGVRLDRLRSTMLNPDEVVIPLLKPLSETDDQSSAKHVPEGPIKPLEVPPGVVVEFTLWRSCPNSTTHVLWTRRTKRLNVSAHFARSPERQAAAVETRKKSGRTPANHAGSPMCYMLIASSRSSKPAGDEGVDPVTQRTAGNRSAIELAINSADPLSLHDIVPTTTLTGAVTKQLTERQQLSFDDADCRSTAEVTRPSNANRTKTPTPCDRRSGGGDIAEPKSFQLSRVLTDQVPICLPGYKGYVLSFSGWSANLDNFAEQGSCSWILWSLPTWGIVTAACSHLQSATTTIAKCTGLSKGIWSAIEHGVTDLIVVGDLQVAVQQSIGATVRRQQQLSESSARQKKCAFRLTPIRYHQVAREYNSSARSLAAEALESQISKIVLSEPRRAELKALNRIQEVLYIDEQTARERDLANEQNQAPVRAKIHPVIQASERLTSVTTRGARHIKFLEPTERQTPSRNKGKEVRENAWRAKEQIDTLWRLDQLAVSVGDCRDRGGADGDDTVEGPRQPSRFEYSGRVKLFLERVKPDLINLLAYRWHWPYRIKQDVENVVNRIDLSDKAVHHSTQYFDEELFLEVSWVQAMSASSTLSSPTEDPLR
ncbi:unnamed protein product [Phytophthora fragariaefolia]|uniref:Unnamed protein product n=1 Tax=Phytophthora fragariaefolia TaxID=1490495 RepID=A0A9W6XYT4_9STRA|nr:unnamed protein product [Phytophthora fragariaefolia]